jgi:hypothetical protein
MCKCMEERSVTRNAALECSTCARLLVPPSLAPLCLRVAAGDAAAAALLVRRDGGTAFE